MTNQNQELLSKFKNSEVRYNKSALFRMTIEKISRGADLYEIIDELINITDETQENFQNYTQRDTRPLEITVTKEQIESLKKTLQ